MTIENPSPERDSALARPWTRQEFVDCAGGVRLFVRMANPAESARATVVITHGLGEHSNRYGHVAEGLMAHGCQAIAWDLRGHGRSGGMRGDVVHYDHFLEDFAAVSEPYRAAEKPLFLFAHSLGGQIVLRFLQEKKVACQGAIIASPWLRLAYDPPWWKLALAQLAMRCWPGMVQPTGHRWERLSRDRSHLLSFPDAELVHHGISARMYFAVREAGEQVMADAARLTTPLLLLHGDADPVTSHHATCEFFERTSAVDKTLRIYPGSRHETHNDLDREQVIREIADWVEARLPARP